MMEYQRVRKGGLGYNEVIVNTSKWALPAVIEGIFETQPGAGGQLHAAFLATYDLSPREFPLLRLDIQAASPGGPFVEVRRQ